MGRVDPRADLGAVSAPRVNGRGPRGTLVSMGVSAMSVDRVATSEAWSKGRACIFLVVRMQMCGGGYNRTVNVVRGLCHIGKSCMLSGNRHVRIGQTDKFASGMCDHGLDMAYPNQTTTNNENAFHITAPICHGTNS